MDTQGVKPSKTLIANQVTCRWLVTHIYYISCINIKIKADLKGVEPSYVFFKHKPERQSGTPAVMRQIHL